MARQKGWKVEGQLEKGEAGTPHYQLMLNTGQVRFSAVKKAFPRAHIEPARNAQALGAYVTKEDTRVGQLSVGQEKYPSKSRFWSLIYAKVSTAYGGPADEIDWAKVSDKRKLDMLDDACYELITEGYYVESIAVNPQVRAEFAKFAGALMARTFGDSQTDRQPTTENVAVVNIPTDNGRPAVLWSDWEEAVKEGDGTDACEGEGQRESDCEAGTR